MSDYDDLKITPEPAARRNHTGSCWVYWRSEPGVYTVGYYRPDGHREPDSDHDNRESAARRVHWLNGGN